MPSTVTPATLPFIPEIKTEHFKPTKRGRGRPKGSKNKKKKITMECGSQTFDNVFESKMSSMSSSPSSAMEDEHDQVPPPLPMFLRGGIDIDLASRSPLKNPPRLEPQVEQSQVKLKHQKEVIILESDDNDVDEDDRSTIGKAKF